MGEGVLQEEISITLQVAWLVTFAQYILKHDNGELSPHPSNSLFYIGDGRFGDKSVNDIAVEYVEASRQNLHKFQPPRIFFVFCDGITESISRELVKSLIVCVQVYHVWN